MPFLKSSQKFDYLFVRKMLLNFGETRKYCIFFLSWFHYRIIFSNFNPLTFSRVLLAHVGSMRFTHHIVPFFVRGIHLHAVLDVALPVEIVGFGICPITFVPIKICRLIEFVIVPNKSWFLASVVQSYPSATPCLKKVTNKTKDKDMWLAIIPQKNGQHIVKTKSQTLP